MFLKLGGNINKYKEGGGGGDLYYMLFFFIFYVYVMLEKLGWGKFFKNLKYVL